MFRLFLFLTLCLVFTPPADADLSCKNVFHQEASGALFQKEEVEFLQIYHGKVEIPNLQTPAIKYSIVQTTRANGDSPQLNYLTEMGTNQHYAQELRKEAEQQLSQAFSPNKKFTDQFIEHLDHLNADLPVDRVSNSFVRRTDGKILGHMRVFDGSIRDSDFPERNILYGAQSNSFGKVLQDVYFKALKSSLTQRLRTPSYDFLMPFERALIERDIPATEVASLFPAGSHKDLSFFELGRYFLDAETKGPLRSAVRNYLIFKTATMLQFSSLNPEKVYLFAHCYGEHAKIYALYGFEKVGQFINQEGKEEFVLRTRGDHFLKKIGSEKVIENHLKNLGSPEPLSELTIEGKLSELLWPFTFGKMSLGKGLELFQRLMKKYSPY